MNVNKAIVVGRVTQDLELKTTPAGREVLTFSVATNRTWKDSEGVKQEKTDFHNLVSWGKQAGVLAQYVIKGQEMYFEGRMETRNWEDKETGKKMYRTEIVVDQFEFGSKPGGASGATAKPKSAQEQIDIEYPDEEIDPEDIPF